MEELRIKWGQDQGKQSVLPHLELEWYGKEPNHHISQGQIGYKIIGDCLHPTAGHHNGNDHSVS